MSIIILIYHRGRLLGLINRLHLSYGLYILLLSQVACTKCVERIHNGTIMPKSENSHRIKFGINGRSLHKISRVHLFLIRMRYRKSLLNLKSNSGFEDYDFLSYNIMQLCRSPPTFRKTHRLSL
jgi:hypothetical protein